MNCWRGRLWHQKAGQRISCPAKFNCFSLPAAWKSDFVTTRQIKVNFWKGRLWYQKTSCPATFYPHSFLCGSWRVRLRHQETATGRRCPAMLYPFPLSVAGESDLDTRRQLPFLAHRSNASFTILSPQSSGIWRKEECFVIINTLPESAQELWDNQPSTISLRLITSNQYGAG